MNNLKGKVAVVTGGGGVLGSAFCEGLAKQGVKVAILNRKIETSQALADKIIADGGEAIAVSCDVLNKESVIDADKVIFEKFGPVDILLNAAGGNDPRGQTTEETFKPEDLEKDSIRTFYDMEVEGFNFVYNLNFVGTLIPCQVFSKRMIGRKGCTIINISSMASTYPMTKVPAYAAAKAGIDNFTKWLAVHMADAGIRVNAIAPGFFLTTQNKNLLINPDGSLTHRSGKIMASTPMKRFGDPKELVGTLLWLSDDSASGFVTGVTVPVDGGFMAYSGV